MYVVRVGGGGATIGFDTAVANEVRNRFRLRETGGGGEVICYRLARYATTGQPRITFDTEHRSSPIPCTPETAKANVRALSLRDLTYLNW